MNVLRQTQGIWEVFGLIMSESRKKWWISCCRRCSVHGADPQHAPEWVLGFLINYRYIFFFRCSMVQQPESRLEMQHAAAWSTLVAFTMLTLYKGHTRSSCFRRWSSAQTTLMWDWLTDQPLVQLKQPAAKYGWNVAVHGVSGRTMLTNDSCGKHGIIGKAGEQTELRSDWRESGVSKGASRVVTKLDPKVGTL